MNYSYRGTSLRPVTDADLPFLFRQLPFRKIYFDVFDFNPLVVRIWRKLGLAEEGLLKGERFWDGKYWDVHVFALYREAWPDLRARVLRPERAGAAAHSPRCNGDGRVTTSDTSG